MGSLSVKQIEKLIYPVSFYRNKARFMRATCDALVRRFGGKVPRTLEELMTLPGVGRKTANLVMILRSRVRRTSAWIPTCTGFRIQWMGWVKTREPNETEQALYEATDERWWRKPNLYLVTWGQNVCQPLSSLRCVCAGYRVPAYRCC